MKQTILALVLLSSIASAQAQTIIPAGTISLGGSIGYSHYTNTMTGAYNNVGSFPNTTTAYETERTVSSFSLAPATSYFIDDNLALGLSLGYATTHRTYTTTFTPVSVQPALDPSTSLQVGAFLQYYKMIIPQFGVTGAFGGGYQRSVNYSYNNTGNGTDIIEAKATGYYAALTPGIVFFPIPKFSLSASIGSLGYSRDKYDSSSSSGNSRPDKNTESTFGASFGFSQLLFGGTYYFGR